MHEKPVISIEEGGVGPAAAEMQESLGRYKTHAPLVVGALDWF